MDRFAREWIVIELCNRHGTVRRIDRWSGMSNVETSPQELLCPSDPGAVEAWRCRPIPSPGCRGSTGSFCGGIEHADSAGYHTVVRPGELNLMTAGRRNTARRRCETHPGGGPCV
ncbi:pirin family protein [Arthrobacter alpinus]|uniref:pirin family protein n=1 Tax=Arthrobacter alpinus TaxID=656366 RepID=UPI0037C1281D